MSMYIQDCPVLDPASSINDINSLPVDAKIIGHIVDTAERAKSYYLVRQGGILSILSTFKNLKTNKVHSNQYDFPIRVLSWFPRALVDFQRPPEKGGLNAGAMTSADENVDGEYLCIQAGSEGYHLVNRSRQSPLGFAGSYMPTSLALSYRLLYDFGLLELWKELASKYESNTL